MKLFNRYPTTIWIRVIGTVLSKVCDFMVRSFAGIYLYEKMGQDILTSASVTVAGPALGLAVTSFAGGWSDRIGRKPVMVVAIFVQGLAILGYLGATNYSHFIALSLIIGLAHSMYWPAAQAQVTDLIEPARRGEVFALMHVALNVGAALGPMIGVSIYRHSPAWAFIISSIGLLLFALILLLFTVESAPRKLQKQESVTIEVSARVSPWRFMINHRAIFWLTLGSIPVSLIYSQMELIFPLHLRARFPDYLKIFGMLMTINGTCVTLLQLPIQRWIQRLDLARSIAGAHLIIALTAIGYAWSPIVGLLVASELIFTLGEMIGGPQIQRVVGQIAPVALRARYFSIHAMNWGFGGVLGPILGALACRRFGGSAWFTTLAVLVAAAGFAQFKVARKALAHPPA